MNHSAAIFWPILNTKPGGPARNGAGSSVYGLHAILKLHFQKVEELYLPVLDCWLTQERARILFGHMADRPATANASVPRAG